MLVFDMEVKGKGRSILLLTVLKNTLIFFIQLILLPPDELSLSRHLRRFLRFPIILWGQFLQFRLQLKVLLDQSSAFLLKK
jgi:hypothetical protein